MAALIKAGQIAQVSDRPRSYRVLVEIAAPNASRCAPVREETTPNKSNIAPVRATPSAAEIRTRFEAELAAHARSGLPALAVNYIASSDLQLWLREALGHRSVEEDELGERIDGLVMDALGCSRL